MLVVPSLKLQILVQSINNSDDCQFKHAYFYYLSFELVENRFVIVLLLLGQIELSNIPHQAESPIRKLIKYFRNCHDLTLFLKNKSEVPVILFVLHSRQYIFLCFNPVKDLFTFVINHLYLICIILVTESVPSINKIVRINFILSLLHS